MTINELDHMTEWELRDYFKSNDIPFTTRFDRYMGDLIITADLPNEDTTNFYFDKDWD